jgi:hypothetical protein
MSLALITAGTLFGILLLGLWGDVVIGAIIVGAARLVEAAAKPVARGPWSTHGRESRAPAQPRAHAPLARAESSRG